MEEPWTHGVRKRPQPYCEAVAWVGAGENPGATRVGLERRGAGAPVGKGSLFESWGDGRGSHGEHLAVEQTKGVTIKKINQGGTNLKRNNIKSS